MLSINSAVPPIVAILSPKNPTMGIKDIRKKPVPSPIVWNLNFRVINSFSLKTYLLLSSGKSKNWNPRKKAVTKKLING